MNLHHAHQLAMRKSLDRAEFWSDEGVYVAITNTPTYITKPQYEHPDCPKKDFTLIALYVDGKLSDGFNPCAHYHLNFIPSQQITVCVDCEAEVEIEQ